MSDEQTPHPAGIVLRPPPPSTYGAITAAVEAYADTLKPEEHGGVVGIVTTTGINGAIVQKLGDGHGTIVGWIGKSWGVPDLEAGLAWKLRW
jgi:hypothetical protein